jgi:hypothetical protein
MSVFASCQQNPVLQHVSFQDLIILHVLLRYADESANFAYRCCYVNVGQPINVFHTCVRVDKHLEETP